jgi:chromosome segregation ATPase
LDEVTQLLQILHVGNFQLVGKVRKLEQEGEKRTEENRQLRLQVQRLDHEMKRSNSELQESHLQVQQLEEEMARLEKSSSLVQDLGGQISALKSHVFLLVEEKENVLYDVRVVQEQIQDVIQEGGQVLSPNIIAREEHPQELEMENDHLASTLVQSEDELREEKSELTKQLDSFKQHVSFVRRVFCHPLYLLEFSCSQNFEHDRVNL